MHDIAAVARRHRLGKLEMLLAQKSKRRFVGRARAVVKHRAVEKGRRHHQQTLRLHMRKNLRVKVQRRQ